ncbi:MAG: glycosyltransferase, partial [Gemmatimonadales bacterium]
MTIGVVIPTLNEEASLPALLMDLRELGTAVPLSVVVADGGSTDGTRACAAAAGVRVLGA